MARGVPTEVREHVPDAAVGPPPSPYAPRAGCSLRPTLRRPTELREERVEHAQKSGGDVELDRPSACACPPCAHPVNAGAAFASLVLHSFTIIVSGFGQPLLQRQRPTHSRWCLWVSRLLTEVMSSSTILVMQRNRRLQTLQRMRRPEPIEQSRLSPTCAPTRRRHPLTVQADSSSFVSYLQLFVSTPSTFCCVQRSIIPSGLKARVALQAERCNGS